MKLLIISHTAHYRRDGDIVGWGPTVQEIDYLATLFDSVTHLAPLHRGESPPSALPYSHPGIRLRAVTPSGGPHLWDKLGILARIPQYGRAILQELKQADMVHVRCPANISLVAIFLLALLKRPRLRWIKYAGNWQPNRPDPLSYRFQRWFLSRNFARSIVTVNGTWPDQPAHIRSFHNPALPLAQIEHAAEMTQHKRLTQPIQLLFVGRLDEAKGIGRALHIMKRLHTQGIPASLGVLGDGPDRVKFEQMAEDLGITPHIIFHGWLPRAELGTFYAQAHILLLPSDTEGWPKVISEAMAHRAVPVCSHIGSIPHYLQELGLGRTCPPHDTAAFADAIMGYALQPELWQQEALKAQQAAGLFSYEHYLKAVRQLMMVEAHGKSA